ncbi:hypothetical protein SLEP1_g4955 [Rubroshorea leprosula]|uniref:Uncharacterized protein n=1 Tax=Rubroshorea leprosula TaxID=152421 RepID=A0AAV5I061_9ROSI|nr:hypothetical protein SLEP1_g4955 [Rubroshorea leprosula]
MKKDISNRHEVSKVKAYRPKKRHFIYHEDCSDILDWIRQTQASRNGLVSI